MLLCRPQQFQEQIVRFKGAVGSDCGGGEEDGIVGITSLFLHTWTKWELLCEDRRAAFFGNQLSNNSHQQGGIAQEFTDNIGVGGR